nr:hypothetical protein [Alkalihalobacillus deserti]
MKPEPLDEVLKRIGR